MEIMYKLDGREIATIAISLAKIMKEVESYEQQSATRSNSLHQTLHNLLIGEVNSEKKLFIFNEIAAHATPILTKFDARCLSNLIYSVCLADCAPEVKDGSTILDSLALEAISKLQNFNCQELSNMLWSYAKMKSTNSVLFKAAGDSIVGMDNVGEFKPQELSNIAWAYATAGESHPLLYKKFADHIVTMNDFRNFWPQALSNIMWSYATADEAHPKLFSKLGDHIVAMKDLSTFKPQALSNIVWAYATTFQSHPLLFSKFADHIVTMKDLGLFKPQALSNIVWAFATTGQRHPKLYKKLGDHIASLDDLNRFIPQELSNIVWAYATTGESHSQLFNKVGDHIGAMKDLSAYLPQDYSNFLWSYATAGELHPLLFQKFAHIAISRSNDFKPRELSNLLWAYATVAIIDKHLFTSFAPAVKLTLGKCNCQALANISWSYAVASVNEPLLFNTDFVAALQAKVNDFSLKDLSQLHQWQLWQNEIKSGIRLPSALREKCRQAFVSQSYQSSIFQDDVISVLSSIGLRPKEEELTSSGYRLDALVEVNGTKIGIEVDGPYHFMNQEPTGSTLLKRRQVSTLDGICIVSVPYWDWDKFGLEDQTKKQQYLRSKLGLHPVRGVR
jgi:tryptophan-rich sensory protein